MIGNKFPDCDPQGLQMKTLLLCAGLCIANIQLNCNVIFLAAFREHLFILCKLLGKRYFSRILRLWIRLANSAAQNLLHAHYSLATIAPGTIAPSIPSLTYPTQGICIICTR
jgi:hypothetical protein